MSAPLYTPQSAPVYPPQQSPKNGLGTAGFVLGLLAALFALIPIIGVIAWPMAILGLIFGVLGISRARHGVATNKGLAIAGTTLAAVGLLICIAWVAALTDTAENASTDSNRSSAAAAALDSPGDPSGDSTLPFGQIWTSDNGNTIVTGTPTVGTSDSPMQSGESVIRVAVTLTNNGQEQWSPVFTTFGGTLNGAPVQESVGEGDWLYSTPIAPGASVTLTKVFLGGNGDFALTVSTPHGTAFFTGQA
ncbi:MAG: DUF4190 domain-containing protein [Pseudonocardiaceae bacterium]